MKPRREPIVLIVDDDPEITEAVADVLTGSGYELKTMFDGRATLDALREMALRPCVVVTDLQMPEMDGFELIRTIRADGQMAHVRIVVLSGVAHRAPPEADAVLTKPFEFLELRAIISLLFDAIH